MNTQLKISGLTLMLLIFFNANAQENKKDEGWITGNSITYSSPIGNMDSYNYGLGFYANVDYIFNKHITARLDIGWNEFTGSDHKYIDTEGNFHSTKPTKSVWEFTAGLRANAGILYIEGRGGYFTGIHEWGVVPAVGLRYKKFDLQANFTMANGYHWGGLRLAYYWGK